MLHHFAVIQMELSRYTTKINVNDCVYVFMYGPKQNAKLMKNKNWKTKRTTRTHNDNAMKPLLKLLICIIFFCVKSILTWCTKYLNLCMRTDRQWIERNFGIHCVQLRWPVFMHVYMNYEVILLQTPYKRYRRQQFRKR